MNKIEETLNSKAIIRKGIILFSKEDALEFIKLCKIEKIDILGIDCFLLGNDWIQPNMENSVDFSNFPQSFNRFDEALDFITTRDEKYYFEIVCDD